MLSDQMATEIQTALAEFERLDRELPRRLPAGDLAYLESVRTAKNRIKDLLATNPTVRVEGRVQTALRRVRDNDGYNIDRLYELMGPWYFQESDDRDYVEALFTEGTADYVDEHFFRRRRQAGAIVVSQGLPAYVLHRVRSLVECYALGLFPATVVFCRAVVEAAMFEALKRRGRIRSSGNVVDHAEYSAAELRQRVRPFLSRRLWGRVCGSQGVTKLADQVLHGKAEVTVGEREAYESLKASFALVEELFA
jgi:hypothetical protein